MQRIINIGMLAHVDAGKTTTVEQLLYRAGGLRMPGSVEKGTTFTDWLRIERERGISVRNASARLMLEEESLLVNIIDTPGHMDFTGEVDRALSVLDAVVLAVSAAEGIQSQTERFWDAIRTRKLPCLFFVNKIDRTGCEPEWIYECLREQFAKNIFALNMPVAYGDRDCRVEQAFGEQALLLACDLDEALAELYLAGEEIPAEMAEAALKKAVAEAEAFPLVYGSSLTGAGMEDLLRAIAFFPSAQPQPEGEPSGIVYKIEHDAQMGKIAHVRLYQGTLRNRDQIRLHRPAGSFGSAQEPIVEKIHQIRRVLGAKKEDSGILTGGDIAAVCGLSGAKIGDILGEAPLPFARAMAQPLFSVKLQAGEENIPALLAAVRELSDEDPLLDYAWDSDVRELSVSILGRIQIETLAFLLLERYGLSVEFSPPSVIYRETPKSRGHGFEAYTMPKPCWAVVGLLIEPLPRGAGYRFESVVPDKELHYRYQAHVEASVPETLKQGIYGWPVVDCKVILTEGQDHHIHTHPLDFFLATPIATLRALTDAGSQILEPLLRLKLSAEEGLAGRIVGDILDMRGEFDSPVVTAGNVHIEALVPVKDSMDYHHRFASLTSGRGQYTADFSGYRECPLELASTLPRRGVNPLDRDKWILHKRGAIH